jgi:hypothetical protein
VLLTYLEQNGNKSMSDAVKREITQGLQEGHGADKGFCMTLFSCKFYEFETCEEINVSHSRVRLLTSR